MKTDYTPEIKDLLQNLFEPSTPEDKEATALTLEEIHSQVINVLPAKWIDTADVYQVLTDLHFAKAYVKPDEAATDKKEITIKYYFKLKI